MKKGVLFYTPKFLNQEGIDEKKPRRFLKAARFDFTF
jgi:hypothetical protein